VIVVSSDTEERARKARDWWKLERLTIGHSLRLESARAWSLHVSSRIGTTSAGVEEPSAFSEPSLFLVRPGGTLYFGAVQTIRSPPQASAMSWMRWTSCWRRTIPSAARWRPPER
jgi:hypothetical protein